MSDSSVRGKLEALIVVPMVATAFFLNGCQTNDREAHTINTPPPGFTAIFNGTNLDGWWGATTEDPRKYLALSPAEFKTKHDASLEDIRQHGRYKTANW
ncbi:MAG: hypothetical protein WDM80_17740 [Limisphaerales bacterium]